MGWDYKVRFQGRGQGLNDYGVLQIVDGRLFLCDADLSDLIAKWNGKLIEIGFWLSEDSPELPPDPLVWPLVEALQAKGVRTFSSCQGHMGNPEKETYPFVSFYEDDRDLITLAPGWVVEKVSGKAWRLRPKFEAKTQNELDYLQVQLRLQTDVIKGLE